MRNSQEYNGFDITAGFSHNESKYLEIDVYSAGAEVGRRPHSADPKTVTGIEIEIITETRT